ncbi:hypothetical protein BELL_0017g00050 [Botrytis elliptica]|uniref:Uncharacterized protein n=1 Tax=Botrytis elliptica TaxID=278938 RepID=A0A4Z1K1H4_9HELO|nr:hypothetical protein EAE99_001006 [Botrytis elliptica]TGO79991.1 hypothetical protein BELL_0017g00050 [Botrytis elliptica]
MLTSARHQTDLSLNTQPPLNEARTPILLVNTEMLKKAKSFGARNGAFDKRLKGHDVMIGETAQKQIFVLERQEGGNLRSGTSLAALTLQAPSALLSPLSSPKDGCQLWILEVVDVEVMEMETKRGKIHSCGNEGKFGDCNDSNAFDKHRKHSE